MKRERNSIDSHRATFSDKEGYTTQLYFEQPDLFYLEQKSPTGKKSLIHVDDYHEVVIFSIIMKFLHQTKGKIPLFARAEFPRQKIKRESPLGIEYALRVGRVPAINFGTSSGNGISSKVVYEKTKPFLEITMSVRGGKNQTIRLNRAAAVRIAHAFPRVLSPESIGEKWMRGEVRNAAVAMRWLARRKQLDAPPGAPPKLSPGSPKRRRAGR